MSDHPDPRPIRYTLSFPAPQTHYVEVEAVVPAGGLSSVDLEMAVWTPGSYLVREYSRHVEQVRAESEGQLRVVEKIAKNRWRVTTAGAQEVTVRYRVYGREMTVRTNYIEATSLSSTARPRSSRSQAIPRPGRTR
jgi:predicted metalloprotease with PDZ domain